MDLDKKIDKILTENLHTTQAQKDYSDYLITHINNVKRGFFWIKENCPKILQYCNVNETENNIIVHDESKYSPEEFNQYANYFYGEKTSEVKKQFNIAWKHHYMNNKHHPEWWHKLPMSEEAIVEMICDWWSFSWKSGQYDEVFSFWNKAKNGNSKTMNQETKDRVDELLGYLREALIEHNLIGG